MNARPEGPDAQGDGGAGEYVGVGASLRQSRLETGRDLPDVAAALCIRRAHLQAIEDGRFDDLPGQVYAIGFIRAYADFLELDSDWVVDRFREEVDPRDANPDLNFPEVPAQTWRSRLGIAGAAAAIAAVAWGGWYFYENRGGAFDAAAPEPPENAAGFGGEAGIDAGFDPEFAAAAPGAPPDMEPPDFADPLESPADAPPAPGDAAGTEDEEAPAPATLVGAPPDADAADETPAEAPPPAVEAPPDAAPAADDAGGRVVLRAVRDSWVRVAGPDGRTVLSRVLRAGETWHAPDRAGLSMIVGNAGGLEVAVDGVTLPPLGEENRVRRDVPLDPDALLAAAPPVAAETEAAPDAAPEDAPEAATGAGPETAPEDAPDTPSEAASAADDAGGRVVLRAVRDSWVRVAGPDNRTVLSRVLRAGETWQAPDRAGLSMVVGNAGGLEVVVDGVTLPPLGEENRTRRDVPLDVEALLAFAR